MTTTVPITMRADPDIKAGFEQIAAIFEETANNEKEHAKLWFKALHGGEVPSYSESNMRHLRASIADAKAGRVFEHDLIED